MTDPDSLRVDGAGSQPATEDPASEERGRALFPMPVNVRSVSLAVLATLASIFMLQWASIVFIPICLALLFSYALSPLVDWLQKHRIPRALSAAFLILGLFSGFGATLYSLSDEASELIDKLPAAAQKLRDFSHARPGQSDSALETVQKAASRLEQAAKESTSAEPVGRGVQRVQIEKPRFDIKDHLWDSTLGLLGMLYQIGMVALIAFFLMTSGDSYRAKLVRLAGPTLSKKKITLKALNQIDRQIQRYLLVQLFTSTLVGVATWIGFLVIDMDNAAVWGIAAGLLNLIPYIGGLIIMSVSALMSLMQFGTLEMAMLVAAISLVIHSIVAFLLLPWLTSRANKMNSVAIFVGVFAWGWLWGVWGMFLAVPILVVIKAICDRIDDLKPVGEFLGA